MTSPETELKPFVVGSHVEIKLPAGWLAGKIKREIPRYTKSGSTAYEVIGNGFVSISTVKSLRHVV